MNQLEQRISSREVADMMEMRHADMLVKIDKINDDLAERKIPLSKYWTEGQYKDASGKSNREYQITKRGCEFLAHKSTGTKGNLFTDRYMDRFAEMEQEIAKPKRLSALEQLNLHNQAILEVDEKVEAVKNDLEEFKQDLPLLGCDMDRITTAVKKMGVKCLGGKESSAYRDKSLRSKVYCDIYDQLKREFGVSTYKSIKRNQCDMAVYIVETYQLPMVLEEEINDCNAQEVFV
jgi:phage regulator Rha-like protein